MQVILVRHGEPGDTPKGTFLGRTDPVLGDEGKEQAAALAAALAPMFGDMPKESVAVFVSPLRRAQETAAPLIAASGWTPRTVDELAEVDFGDWDGLHLDDINQRWDGRGSEWVADPLDHQPPRGESLRQLGQRVDRFWQRDVVDAATRPPVVVVVAHFGPLTWLGGGLLGLPASRRIACRLSRGQAGCIEDGVLRWWGLPTNAGGFF